MHFRTLSLLLILPTVFALSSAAVPSRGLVTAEGIRKQLPDKAFRINPAVGSIVKGPTFKVLLANLAKFPALAGVDVQSQITRVTVKAGQDFIRHYHPRSAEIVTALRGTLDVSFTMEGGRVVKNFIPVGESTLFPMGLVHTTKCISDFDCLFLGVFTSADPGLVII